MITYNSLSVVTLYEYKYAIIDREGRPGRVGTSTGSVRGYIGR